MRRLSQISANSLQLLLLRLSVCLPRQLCCQFVTQYGDMDGNGDDVGHTFTSPNGFQGLLVVHSVFGVSYFGYFDSYLLKLASGVFSLLFLISFTIIHIPCFFDCTFDLGSLFKTGLSPLLVTFIVSCMRLYHVIMTDVIIFFRSERIRQFFRRADDFSFNFNVKLLESQQQKLVATVIMLFFLNVLNMVGECCILVFLAKHRIASIIPSTSSNKTIAISNNSTAPQALVNFDHTTFYYFSLIVRIFAAVHAKALECILIYLAQYLSILLQRLEIRFDKFIYSSKSDRSIEVAKVAFIEMQNLIKDADEVFADVSLNPLYSNIFIIMGSLFIVADGIGRRRELHGNDYYELYQVVVCMISLLLCCSYGEDIEEEMEEVIQAIAYINGESFSEADYRSVSVR